MARFIIRRLLAMLFVMFAVSVLTFLIFNVIPNGDPAARIGGRTATIDQVAAIRKDWGFDQPVWVQYASMMKRLFTGHLVSYFTQLNVTDQIMSGAPRTFSLAIGASVLWLLIGVGLGVLSAARAGRGSDQVLTGLALAGISMPVFWLGAILSFYLGFRSGLFPNAGYVPLTESPPQWAYHLILPWLTLSLGLAGFYSRIVRAGVLDAMGADYIRVARAKGISERQIMLRHALRSSLIPVVTLWGLDLGAAIAGGAILVESVFDLQGVGQYAADSVAQLDVPPVIGVTMFGAFFIVFLNALVDILYAVLDPRIRTA
jgi:peptide/nickel transport system permease protein